METITSFVTYNTDVEVSGCTGPHYTNFANILEQAAELRAKVIVKTSTGSWYIKGVNDNTSYEEIQGQLVHNVNRIPPFKARSRTWLLYY